MTALKIVCLDLSIEVPVLLCDPMSMSELLVSFLPSRLFKGVSRASESIESLTISIELPVFHFLLKDIAGGGNEFEELSADDEQVLKCLPFL